MRQITFAPTFEAWQISARRALQHALLPGSIEWQELDSEQPGLGMFDELEFEPRAGSADSASSMLREDPAASAARRQASNDGPTFRVPKRFIALARRVALHRDATRWPLLYRVLWRLTHGGEPSLMEINSDPDIHALELMDSAIGRDLHKMRAFVRFREVKPEPAAVHVSGPDAGRATGSAADASASTLEPWFVAWFEPEHHIVEANAGFFTDRFANMCWSILTPDRCLHWDRQHLTITAGANKSSAPTEDAAEDLWRKYYSHIFNPARVKVHAMQSSMPKRYWKNLPEATVIPALLQDAPRRVSQMVTRSEELKTTAYDEAEYGIAQPPETSSLTHLCEAAAACRACPLYKNATQTVFGEGLRSAEIVLLGEQPGDQEDRAGKPFIGPAGQLLDRALAAAKVERKVCYVTNVVKHFKWEPRGKRRLHQTPNSRDIAACKPWMEAELAILKPRVLVCLGGTAAKAIFGPSVRVLKDRGHFMESDWCAKTLVTVHPSSLLRAPTEEAKEEAFVLFVRDLSLLRGED